MSGEEKPLNPCDLFLPKDYEDDLQYRETQPEINTDTSDDHEDGQNSRQTSPVNTISEQPIPPNPFALLQKTFKNGQSKYWRKFTTVRRRSEFSFSSSQHR